MNYEQLATIHDSFINGQKKQMTEQIDEYGELFWSDYETYLTGIYLSVEEMFSDFVNLTVAYFAIKNS